MKHAISLRWLIVNLDQGRSHCPQSECLVHCQGGESNAHLSVQFLPYMTQM